MQLGHENDQHAGLRLLDEGAVVQLPLHVPGALVRGEAGDDPGRLAPVWRELALQVPVGRSHELPEEDVFPDVDLGAELGDQHLRLGDAQLSAGEGADRPLHPLLEFPPHSPRPRGLCVHPASPFGAQVRARVHSV